MKARTAAAFLSRLRAIRSGPQRLALLSLLACLLLGHGLLVQHRIDHAGSDSSIECVLCSVADHQAAAPSLPALAVVTATPPASPPFAAGFRSAGLVHAYRSRAPPIARQA